MDQNRFKQQIVAKLLDAAKTIPLGTLIYHLNYANSLNGGLLVIDIKKLQRIQTLTAKVVLLKSFQFN